MNSMKTFPNIKPSISLLFFTTLIFLNTVQLTAQSYSELWGKQGENWSPESRLPDFSFAGYHSGEDPLPEYEVTANVLDFGGKGDGKTDCTQAFRDAINKTEQGAILIPAGRYLISDIIWLEKPNLVLRGEGPGKTVITTNRTLEEVKPNMGATTSGKPTSRYSWSGGFLWMKGNIRDQKLAQITSEMKRGSRELTLSTPVKLKTGERVVIELMDDRNKSLINHLYSGEPDNTSEIKKTIKPRFVSKVTHVKDNQITLERPLCFDIRQEWSPVLKTFAPSVQESGIEDLSIEFPVTPYKGHFTELGFNGIAMNHVSDCWVRNVHIANCDSGIYVSGYFCTVDGLVITSERPRNKDSRNRTQTGHHGISMGTDCLVTNFDIQTHFIHDITLSKLNSGNVIKNGRGENLSLDHHKVVSHDNLFTNLDAGLGTELWRCGGGRNLGKHTGARGTFWGIRTDVPVSWPPKNFGPASLNFVGLKSEMNTVRFQVGKWWESIPVDDLQPLDLHAAQLEKRLGSRQD